MKELIPIQKVSARFKNSLKSVQYGTVISSFSKVLNIMTPMGVFTLQESSVPFSPLSLVLEDSRRLKEIGIKPNDKIEITETEISCNGICFSFEDATVIDTVLHPSLPERDKIKLLPFYIDNLREKLMEYRGTADAGGLKDISNHMEIINGILVFNDMPSDDPLLNYIRSKLEGSLVISTDFAESLASLIGLGFGLTPSCDDFLVGLLSTMAFCREGFSHLEQFRNHLIEEIRPSLAKTTSVSSAFLDAALTSQFSEMILNFYLDCNHTDEIIRRKNIEKIASIGHSSGIDSLNGINFGFKLIFSLH